MLLEQFQEKGQYHILGGTEVGEEVLGMGFALTGAGRRVLLDTPTAVLQEARENLQQFRSWEGTFWQKNQAACIAHSNQLKGEGQK